MEYEVLKKRCEDGLSVIAQRYIPDRVERQQLEQAAVAKALPFSLVINWEALATDLVLKLLRNVGDLVIELGREHRDDIERAASDTIIAIVTWDIPGLPESIERKFDAAFQRSATQAVKAMLDSILGTAA